MIENSMEVFATIPAVDGEITYKIVTNDYDISGDDERCIYDALTSHHQLLGPDPVVIGARYLSSNLQCNVPNPVLNESIDCCAIVDYASDAESKVETPSRRRKRVFQPRQIGELPTSVLHSYIVVADLFNEISRQAAEVGSRALGIPRRLDESLARIEQGDLQVQIRAGETDRLLRRLALAQQAAGQSFLLGGLAVAASLLAASMRPALAAIPLVLGLPVGLGWLKLQARLKRDGRLDQMPGIKGE